MADYRVELLSAAWQDLDRIADFHMRMVGPVSAQKITDEILETLSRLSHFPMMGSLHPDDVLAKMEYRKILCLDYVCIYRVVNETVYVYRIVHGATNYPKYFKQ